MLITLILILVQLYLFILLGYVILSFVIVYAHLDYDSPVYKIQRVFSVVCDPVLNPIRRIIPPARIGNVGLDLSVLILFLVIELILIPILTRSIRSSRGSSPRAFGHVSGDMIDPWTTGPAPLACCSWTPPNLLSIPSARSSSVKR